jgi:hypothetical protein
MRLPSGDHVGLDSSLGSNVKRELAPDNADVLMEAGQGQPCVFTWSKYVRRASISAALASRICSSKLAKLCSLVFVAARCSSSSLLTRLEQSVHWESNNIRSGHFSAIFLAFSHAAALQGASACVTLVQRLGVYGVELFLIRASGSSAPGFQAERSRLFAGDARSMARGHCAARR